MKPSLYENRGVLWIYASFDVVVRDVASSDVGFQG